MKHINNKKGFTLLEILVAVLIMIILVTMATPMYERAIEKSRKAEVSIALKRIAEAKLRLMDQRNSTTFSQSEETSFWRQMDAKKPAEDVFTYKLYPSDSFKNSVCAKRANKGIAPNTSFLYVNEGDCARPDDSSCAKADNAKTICEKYWCDSEKLFCKGTHCDVYGMSSMDAATCGS